MRSRPSSPNAPRLPPPLPRRNRNLRRRRSPSSLSRSRRSPKPADQGNDVGKAIALGVLGAGAAIIAGKLAEQALSEPPPPRAPSDGNGPMVSVRVMSVHSIRTTFGIGGDEIFLLASNGQRFPPRNNAARSINAGQTWAPSAPFSAPGGLSIELREYDSISADDVIGNFAVDANVRPGRYTATLRGGGGVYQVTYDVAVAGDVAPVQPVAARPNNPRRVWAAHGQGSGITVTDCRDNCEEDIGIIFMCQGEGLPARVDVPWVALDNAQEGEQKPIAVVVDGRHFDYTATLGGPGLVGHVPSFMVAPGDPLIDALQGGRVAQVQFDGSGVNIGLRGSRQALDIFKAHCGWNGAAAAGAGGGQAPAPADQPLWYASSFTDENGELGAEPDLRGPGNRRHTVQRTLHAQRRRSDRGAACRSGQLRKRSGRPGHGTDVARDLPLRRHGLHLARRRECRRASQPAAQRSGVAGDAERARAGPLRRRRCSAMAHIGGRRLRRIRPVPERLPDGVGGSAGNAAAATAGGAAAGRAAAATAGQQPAVQQPEAVQPQQPEAVQPQQPAAVAGSQTFTCDDGSTLMLSVVPAGQATVANVVLSDGTQAALISVPSTVGTKYTNGTATLVVNGNSAQWVSGGGPKFCVNQ